MNIKEYLKRYTYIIGALFIFFLFLFISKRTPVAGDDWGYAINGMHNNPLDMAFAFYNSWSGRFFSELYGFLVAPRKELWNLLNPIFFSSIFVLLYKIVDSKKNTLFTVVLIVFLMLSVENNVRMETYTWIMGTTYIIPLFLSLLYIYLIINLLTKNVNIITFIIISNVALFIAGLMMENISAALVVATFFLMIYTYLNNRQLFKIIVVNFLVAVISFIILRMSPGASSRLLRDNLEWSNLTIIGKICYGYPGFIKMSFLAHKYMITLLSLSLIGLITYKSPLKLPYKIVFIILNLISILSVFSIITSEVFNLIYWPIYVLSVFIIIIKYIDDKQQKNKVLLLLMIGGTSSIVMLLSPLYGYRSTIYLIYYLFMVIAIIFNQWLDNKKVNVLIAIVLLFLIISKTKFYINIYQEVERINEIRMSEIDYYKRNPESEEVWIQRFPVLTVHGADIDPGDVYHFEVFKEYYKLPQDANKIYFYIVE